jgi:hypothetical protein
VAGEPIGEAIDLQWLPRRSFRASVAGAARTRSTGTRPGTGTWGAVSLGYSPSGTLGDKKVMGRTKTEVREKLKELHAQVESVRPRRHYTVNDALQVAVLV